MSKLPKGWAITTLDSVADWGSGGTPSRKNPEFFNGDIPWIKTGELGDKYVRNAEEFLSEEAIRNSSAKVFPKGSVGIAMYGATIGKASIWGIDASTNQACAVAQCKTDIINNEFLYYFLLSEKRGFINAGKGGAQPNISQGVLKEWPIALPPLNEQKRIVAKIEELFSGLDKGIESLKTARVQLIVYRQAVLKYAFEGKLTADWREKNKDKLESTNQLLTRIKREREEHCQQQLKEWAAAVKAWEKNGAGGKKPTKPRTPEIPDKLNPEHLQKMWDAPENWQWIQIGDFAFVTKLAGFEYTDYVKYNEAGDLPVIKAENAGVNGFKPTDYSRVHSNTVSHLTRSHLVGGELLVVFVGAGTGNVAMVPKDQKFFLGPNIGMVRPESSAIDSRYVELFLRSPMGKDMILASVKAVAQPSISMGTIRQTPVIIPCALEQEEIVVRLSETLSSIDRIEEEISYNLKKSEALRQSILKKAFSGRLVAQDPADEPASILLERIRIEKSATKPTTKKQKEKRRAA